MDSRNPKEISTGVQLLVEGNDQRNFFEAVIEYLVLEHVQVWNFGGVDDLGKFLRAFVNMRGFSSVSSVGIVRDAEESAILALKRVNRALRNVNLPVAIEPPENGNGRPRSKILILPDGERPGMLETLLYETIAGTEESSCIEQYFDCLGDLAEFSENKRAKARAHAWLATRREPHVSVGFAAKKRYWNLEHEALASVRDFVSSL